jgi:rhodanese-related sulfurtransferase
MRTFTTKLNSALLLFLLGLPAMTLAANKISPDDAYSAALTNRAILVDVREKSEILETSMADLAVWLPTSSIEAQSKAYQDALTSWPKEQKIIFYCRSGKRSEKAANLFSSIGYKTYNAGSHKDWIDAGLPVKSLDPSDY